MPCGIFQWYLRVLYLLLVFGISSAISFNKGGWLIADVFDDDVQPFVTVLMREGVIRFYRDDNFAKA